MRGSQAGLPFVSSRLVILSCLGVVLHDEGGRNTASATRSRSPGVGVGVGGMRREVSLRSLARSLALVMSGCLPRIKVPSRPSAAVAERRERPRSPCGFSARNSRTAIAADAPDRGARQEEQEQHMQRLKCKVVYVRVHTCQTHTYTPTV